MTTDLEYMAAVEVLQQILVSDDDDWNAWAFTFSNSQGGNPYTIATLLEKVPGRTSFTTLVAIKKVSALISGYGINNLSKKFKKINNKRTSTATR